MLTLYHSLFFFFLQFPFSGSEMNVTEEEYYDDDVMSNVTVMGCPSYTDDAEKAVAVFSFWVEGICQVSIEDETHKCDVCIS